MRELAGAILVLAAVILYAVWFAVANFVVFLVSPLGLTQSASRTPLFVAAAVAGVGAVLLIDGYARGRGR